MRRERDMTFDTSFSQLLAAWRTGLAVAAPPSVNPAHTRFLDVLNEVVEAGREIEAAKLRDAEPLRYRQRAATREQRYSARGVYDFTLLRRPDLVRGAVVRIEERPALRGRVVHIRDRTVTVRFESAVDFPAIPPQGGLRPLPSDRVGFLDELRRFNVAISRARRQLVLVGDTETLERAGDEAFGQVMQAMTAYLRHSGDLRTSAEIKAVL